MSIPGKCLSAILLHYTLNKTYVPTHISDTVLVFCSEKIHQRSARLNKRPEEIPIYKLTKNLKVEGNSAGIIYRFQKLIGIDVSGMYYNLITRPCSRADGLVSSVKVNR